MHSRKKLQKKETSAPIPKEYLEYEVSQEELLGGAHKLKQPTLASSLVTICLSCFNAWLLKELLSSQLHSTLSLDFA